LKIEDQFEYEIPCSFGNVLSYNHDVHGGNQLNIQRCDSTVARKLLLFEFPKISNQWSYWTKNCINLLIFAEKAAQI